MDIVKNRSEKNRKITFLIPIKYIPIVLISGYNYFFFQHVNPGLLRYFTLKDYVVSISDGLIQTAFGIGFLICLLDISHKASDKFNKIARPIIFSIVFMATLPPLYILFYVLFNTIPDKNVVIIFSVGVYLINITMKEYKEELKWYDLSYLFEFVNKGIGIWAFLFICISFSIIIIRSELNGFEYSIRHRQDLCDKGKYRLYQPTSKIDFKNTKESLGKVYIIRYLEKGVIYTPINIWEPRFIGYDANISVNDYTPMVCPELVR